MVSWHGSSLHIAVQTDLEHLENCMKVPATPPPSDLVTKLTRALTRSQPCNVTLFLFKYSSRNTHPLGSCQYHAWSPGLKMTHLSSQSTSEINAEKYSLVCDFKNMSTMPTGPLHLKLQAHRSKPETACSMPLLQQIVDLCQEMIADAEK